MALSRAGACVVLVGMSAGQAMAFVPWSNPSGAGSFFNWSEGGSNLGLFGSPTLGGSGNLLVFTPPAFTATASQGSSATTTDLLQVRLTTHAGHNFTQIRISDLGAYQLTGIGVGSVSASGAMFITDLINSRPTQQAAMLMSPVMPITVVPSSGSWSGSVLINLVALPGATWNDIHLSFSNTLQASSSAQSSEHISKTRVTIEILPTPGAASLLAMGGLLAARRRRN
jgi:hypothetical protein